MAAKLAPKRIKVMRYVSILLTNNYLLLAPIFYQITSYGSGALKIFNP
jgi:hypothetical protein